MNKYVTTMIINAIFSVPFTAVAADISGCITTEDGGIPVQIGISIMDSDGYNDFSLGEISQDTGCFFFAGVDEGNYLLEVNPYLFSDSQGYIGQFNPITVEASNNVYDFVLIRGGNITGTVTTETPVNNPTNAPLGGGVYDQDGEYLAWIGVDMENPTGPNKYPYMSKALLPGNYKIRFEDYDNQFQAEWYDNIPDSKSWSAETVPVLLNSVTENIDVALHETAEAEDKYFFGWTDISTIRKRRSSNSSVQVSSSAYTIISKFSDGSPISVDDLDTFTVNGSTTSCSTDGSLDLENPDYMLDYARGIELIDIDDDGGLGDGVIDREDEVVIQKEWMDAAVSCGFDANSHEGGDYTFSLSFLKGRNNGKSLEKNFLFAAPLTETQLPLPSNLTAYWDDYNNRLQLGWDMPEYNTDQVDHVQIRIYPYNNGQWNHTRVRVVNLPETVNSFTLDSKLTYPFNHSQVDQLKIQVRVYGQNKATQARLYETYNFTSTTGNLVPAEISARPYDINGDGMTGLAESIHILRDLVAP